MSPVVIRFVLPNQKSEDVVETAESPVPLRVGDIVNLNGKRFRVADTEWERLKTQRYALGMVVTLAEGDAQPLMEITRGV